MKNHQKKYFRHKITNLFGCLGDASHVIAGPAKPKICDYILTEIKSTIIWSTISLPISFFAVYLAIFRPFGEQASLWASSILFIAMLFGSITKSIHFLKENYMLPINIIQEGSLSYGLEEFLKRRFTLGKFAFGVYKFNRIIGPLFSSRCRNIPSANSVIRDYINYLAKDIILIVLVFTTYIVLIHWIFKPLILEKYAGMTTMQIYLFPITQISQELGW